ncbi:MULTISPECIES: D-aminoacyl-tRNA deacylase [Methanocalculus]|uniref:D-aminoacyl-tRNA deacylase n=1 Tax=Methanocalculus TaxID=71151 RepID=UPI00209E0262|nr:MULTISPECIES: D-aminoacyl-tRNA deacylase [unclassified Methanocalculus]MCP1662209.1 D-aminoacyl-tRNA deacylase [Methanocalculus sp. AMF5]
MVTALVYSALDPAGLAIRSALDELIEDGSGPAWPLLEEDYFFHRTEGRLIYADGLDQEIQADRIIFLSRHTSERPYPVLTVHVTGNFAEAAYGGRPNELAVADPKMMQAVLKNLNRFVPKGYRVAYEVTHHGPTDLKTPSFFVEIGSTENEWRDPEAAHAVARSVLMAKPGNAVPLIGFGGTHYAVRQTAIAGSTRGAFGHIAHTREISSLTPELVALMAERSGAVAGYIDRKAMTRTEAKQVRSLLQQAGLPVITEGTMHELGDVGWQTWCRAADLAATHYPGSVIKNHGMAGDCDPEIVSIHEELLQEALRADEEAFLTLLDTITPSIRITTGGSAALPLFIGCREQKEQLASDLITLCVQQITKHSLSVVEGDRLIIRRDRFDPEKARMLGVPPGPLFGRLAAGLEITVGESLIKPEMVSSRDEREITIPGLERYT